MAGAVAGLFLELAWSPLTQGSLQCGADQDRIERPLSPARDRSWVFTIFLPLQAKNTTQLTCHLITVNAPLKENYFWCLLPEFMTWASLCRSPVQAERSSLNATYLHGPALSS